MRYWTSFEEKRLIEWYETHPDYLNLGELAQETGRTIQFLCRKAGELGLTKLGRKPQWFIAEITERIKSYGETDEGIAARNYALEKMQSQNSQNHPRGMLGKTHTAETKKAMSKRVIECWADPYSKFNSDEFRDRKSDIMSKQMIERLRNNQANNSRSRGGRREDVNNMFFRSSWEANYARYLNFLKAKGLIWKWEYEPDTYYFEQIKRGTRSYTPDFKIWDTETSPPYYVEVKGWMDDKSKVKLNRMAKYYPEVEIRLVRSTEYNEIKSKLSMLIPFWE